MRSPLCTIPKRKMSIDISTENYEFDIGNSKDIEALKLQTENKPMFTKLWTFGKLSSKEAETLRIECLDITEEVITSSGKEFYTELLKLINESTNSGEEIIVHGIYQDDSKYDVRIQKFWGKPVLNQEIIINAISPNGMSTAKWQMVNVGLTDDFNSSIKYSPILESGEIIGIKCGIFNKDRDKKSLWYDLRGMTIRLLTFKFTLTINETNILLNKDNYEDVIRKLDL